MKRKRLYFFCLSLFCFFGAHAQKAQLGIPKEKPYKEVRGMEPQKRPTHTTYAVIEKGDTIPMAYLTSAYIFPKEMFSSERQEKYYWKLVNDIKKVYPLSRVIYATLLETMDYLETIPDEKVRQRHLRQMEKDLVKEYEPTLKKMTYSQGKILLKLINRECNSSPYELIKAYRGGFSAALWQGVATIFRADLKSNYRPESEDYMIERIVIQLEQGQL